MEYTKTWKMESNSRSWKLDSSKYALLFLFYSIAIIMSGGQAVCLMASETDDRRFKPLLAPLPFF